MISKKIFTILIVAFLSKCDLPIDNVEYEQHPVVFGYIDAGFNKVDDFYLYWSSVLSNSHLENNPIDNATIILSNGEQNIFFTHDENGKYEPQERFPNPPIEPGSTWNLYINFNYADKEYTLESSTTVPYSIIPEVIVSDIDWQCDGEEVIFNENDFNLYQNQNNSDLIQSWLSNNDTSFLSNNIEIDNIMYNDADCYTSSFASTPFFTLDIDSQNQNDTVISRYITLALETDKDMNNDGFNIPYEAAIFDTTFSAFAFKGPMQYSDIDYEAPSLSGIEKIYNIYNSNAEDAAYDWCISTPNSQYGCADTCTDDDPVDECESCMESCVGYAMENYGFDLIDIPYEWGWHRDDINRINLEGDQIEFSWLFFNYYGKHMTIIQPMSIEYEQYFEGDPDQFNLPYILRQGNINDVSGEEAYGLFYSTNSKFFLFNVLKPDLD